MTISSSSSLPDDAALCCVPIRHTRRWWAEPNCNALKIMEKNEGMLEDFGYNLKRKEEWNFKRKGITFHYTSKSLIGYHDSDRLFFDEPNPNKWTSSDNLIVGDLTFRYAILL